MSTEAIPFRLLHLVRMRAWIWSVLLVAGLAAIASGCTKPNPRYCNDNDDCGGNQWCDRGGNRCMTIACGNGIVDPGEECDGDDFEGKSCESEAGHSQGELSCTAECLIDTTACHTCGDGAVGPGESCDSTDFGGETCESLGEEPGVLGCTADCEIDTSQCGTVVCGDGTIQPNEACEPGDLAGESCESLGHTGGELACAADCLSFDESGCFDCGDGAAEPGEACDGPDLSGRTCVDEGYSGGQLGCAADCQGYDVSGCFTCGDGTAEQAETCDGTDLSGETCGGLGYTGGTLGCTTDCLSFDESGCFTCGDGTAEQGEACDGPDLAGASCQSLGHSGGQLACAADCQSFDETLCFDCGNGVVEQGEVCEDGELGGETCAGLGYTGGTLGCSADCLSFDDSQCYLCGDGVAELDEQCDGNDLGGHTCVSLGHGGGELVCEADCFSFDETGCFDCGQNGCEHEKGENESNCPLDCGWTTVSAGRTHTCGIREDGSVWCWGYGGTGALGVGGSANSSAPLHVEGVPTALNISAGGLHTCMTTYSFLSTHCWGENGFGQLGDGTTTTRYDPVPLTGLDSAIGASSGHHHTCLRHGASLRCAGLNSSGQLGDGTTSSKDTFVYVDDSQMTDPAIVSSGWSHTCAIDSSSQAWCFGSNSNGQLGTGSTTSRTTPTPVWFLDSPIPFAQISAGDYFTCALESTSDVSCWGKNDRGQIGDGTTIDRLTPVFVDLPSGHAYEQVTAGTRHACALADDGTVYCWGSSSNGQLGNGATIDRHTPVVALMPNAAVFIDAGGNTTCAIDVDGLLWCWGLNNRGQLGDGTTLDRLEPVQVSFP